MNKSPIHAPLEKEAMLPVPSRIQILSALDRRDLSGHKHFLGAGGASVVFNRAVEKALVDEIAEQLRGREELDWNEVSMWAAEIIEAFCGKE